MYTHGPASVRRPFTFSKIFSSKTAWPIKAKFYVEPPLVGGRKVGRGKESLFAASGSHDQDVSGLAQLGASR